jgi:uncharacterized protein (TIGR02271 family)
VSALAGAGIGAAAGGLIGALVDAGLPEDRAHTYAEGVRRGGTLVTVTTPDEMTAQAVDILNRHNPVDVERRSEEWRQAGWTGASMAGTSSQPMTETPGMRSDMASTSTRETRMQGEEEVTMPVVEEELRIGKREVQTGGVRAETTISEQPVEETVNVREEHVEVERRPVDRPVSDEDMSAFKEGVVEFDETSEEVVVDKHARVVEEVTIRKEVEEHPETVRDTVMRQDVEVERMDPRDFEEYEPFFRNHYESAYSTSGYTYDDYMPAYQYGYTLGNTERYRGRNWNEIETDARRDWEARNPDNAWENFKDAIRHGWERVTGQR